MTRWYSEKKKEHFYNAAKQAGYRARSAFKLKQIQEKFEILKEGSFVIDLGAAPGVGVKLQRKLSVRKVQLLEWIFHPFNQLKASPFYKAI